MQAMQKRLESQLTKTEFAAKKVKVKAVKGVKKSVKVNWKSVEGADGYVIEYAKKANFKGKKTVTVSASKKAKTIKRLSAKKTYYVRVKAYKVVDNEKVYTAYSAKKKVRTK
ncbi:fibronectin type III domain-containing protein [Faecalicatena fissicatena]|nr:fibronectin type III domain-containing protein [Faecalicatena fissicatena]